MNGCEVGHKKHKTITVDINLNGRKLPDLPAFTDELTHRMSLRIYDTDPYEGIPEYCTGNSEVSLSIATQGVWEGCETLAVLDILKELGKVLDFGANIGWYSIIAAMHGCEVQAFEADGEHADNLLHNAEINDCANKVEVSHIWVDENLEPLQPARIRLFKSDLEGLDRFTVKACRSSFERKLIDYALIEISPTFNSSFPAMVEEIADYGYAVYQIPPKGFEHMGEYEAAPLDTIIKYCEVPTQGRGEYVAALNQENFLFIRGR